MNPKIKYSLIGCISLILLAGMFSVGLLVGWAFPVGDGTGISGFLNQGEVSPTPPLTPVPPPMLPLYSSHFGRPGRSFMSITSTNR